MTFTRSATRGASTPSWRSRDTSPRARSWPCPRGTARRFRWGSLRTRGLGLELGPDDLRMDEHEARELLGASGLEITDEDVAELTRRTEGWPAGLYLAALSAGTKEPVPGTSARSRATTHSSPISCSRSSSRTC